jgi:hypothetical protein
MRQNYSVDPRCYSVKFADGREYPVHDGRLTIDDPGHIAEMSTSAQVRDGWIHEKKHVFSQVTGGKYCCACEFHAFTWTSRCPKCGARDFVEDAG